MAAERALAGLLGAACTRHPDKLAVACGERHVTYAELDELAQRLAAALVDAGLRGARLATLLPNGLELVLCYLACWRAGVTMAPFEYADAPPEIAYGLADCGARWLIVHEEKRADLARVDLAQSAVERVLVVGAPRDREASFVDLLATAPRALPAVERDALAFVLYTSGSTALPKGVTHSHASAAGIARSVLAALSRIDDNAVIVVHDSVSSAPSIPPASLPTCVAGGRRCSVRTSITCGRSCTRRAPCVTTSHRSTPSSPAATSCRSRCSARSSISRASRSRSAGA